jgi:small subunit ribosomal protein S8
MSFNYTLADLLARIRNGHMAKVSSVNVRYSKFTLSILDVLKREGYLEDYQYNKKDSPYEIKLYLRYFQNNPGIQEIKLLSKPGRRMFSKAKEVPKASNGLGTVFLSTPKGILTDSEAKSQNVGGELLFKIF